MNNYQECLQRAAELRRAALLCHFNYPFYSMYGGKGDCIRVATRYLCKANNLRIDGDVRRIQPNPEKPDELYW